MPSIAASLQGYTALAFAICVSHICGYCNIPALMALVRASLQSVPG